MGASLESPSPLIPVRHASLDPSKPGQSLKAGKSTATIKVQPCPTYPTPIPASKLGSATILYRNGRLLTLKSYLGSCTACRSRNVPVSPLLLLHLRLSFDYLKCSLAHHDIHALSEDLEAHQYKFPKQELNITQQKSLSSVATTDAPKLGSIRLSGNTLVQNLSHLSLGQNKLSNSPIGDSLPKIQARGAQPLLTNSIKLSPSFVTNRYESFRDGQLLVLGVLSWKGYICQHLDGLCKDAYKTSSALQWHFENAHFPYTRLGSPYRYMCSKCLFSNKDFSTYCQNCQAEKSIEAQICGKFIHTSYQRIVDESTPRFFNERDLDKPVSTCTREPMIATLPGTEFADQYAIPSGDMTSEDQILIKLTETNLPWKELAIRFKEQTGKFMTISALQEMKKSLDERFLEPIKSDLPYGYAGDINSIDTKLLKHEYTPLCAYLSSIYQEIF